MDVEELRADRERQSKINHRPGIPLYQLKKVIGRCDRLTKTEPGRTPPEGHPDSTEDQEKRCAKSANARKVESSNMDKFDGKYEIQVPLWVRFQDQIDKDPRLNIRTRLDYVHF